MSCAGLGLATAVIKGGSLGRLMSMGIAPLRAMMSCCFCVSAWGAMAGSVAGISPSAEFVSWWPAAAAVDGLAAASFSWLFYIVTERLSFGLEL